MRHSTFVVLSAAAMPLLLPLGSCTSDNSGSPPRLDAGAIDTSIPAADAEGGGETGSDAPEGSFNLPSNPTIDPGSLATGQLLLTASGELLAFTGYNFPAVNPGDPVFADGWEVRFDHFIATFDKVMLWTNPETSVTDQSQVGSLVAEVDGPWAVDLHQSGAGFPYIDGKEPGERAVAFGVIANQNKNGNQPFLTDGTRYAVGFSEVVATPSAFNVNLGPDGLSRYAQMIQNGCVSLYTGTATWTGNQGRCVVATPVDGGAEGGVSGGTGQDPEFASIPTAVNFDLCFKPRTALPAGMVETTYVNCDNQDNAGPGINMEPHPRGVAFKSNTYTVGEVTFHTDHPFWESIKHDTPAHFDQFASQVSGGDGGVPTVHLEDMKGVDYTGFKDKQGNIVAWRICDPNYNNPNGGSRVGQMNFDPFGVPHCTNNDSSNGLCDYYDYSKYNQSTQGHWNGAEGLCFVKRNYPSPR
ncbi:MAG: hypothetical protein M3O46_18240 [Myxococcota bacterium]|nr:hypothetical protein [Myxococcota bacterium]